MAILDKQDVWAAYEVLFYQNAKAPNDFGIAAEAMSDLLTELTQRVGQDNRLQALIQKLADGKTTYSDLDEFALLLGKHLGNAMYYTMPAYVTWPDGFLTKEVADAIIPPGLRANYETIIEYARVTQKGLNERAKLGLNAVVPDYDLNREYGLIDYVTGKPWSDRAKSFKDAVAENGQYYADESAKANARAHYDVGLHPKIKRVAAWNCCKWCTNLAGTYDYTPNMDTEVFRRHSNCNCKVLYDPGDSKQYQNVHSKKWSTYEELAQRKATQPTRPTKDQILQRMADYLEGNNG